jgi:hypothetical protein
MLHVAKPVQQRCGSDIELFEKARAPQEFADIPQQLLRGVRVEEGKIAAQSCNVSLLDPPERDQVVDAEVEVVLDVSDAACSGQGLGLEIHAVEPTVLVQQMQVVQAQT